MLDTPNREPLTLDHKIEGAITPKELDAAVNATFPLPPSPRIFQLLQQTLCSKNSCIMKSENGAYLPPMWQYRQ